jgi:transposase
MFFTRMVSMSVVQSSSASGSVGVGCWRSLRQPRCVVALEACAGAHHWGRELQRLGHEVRLIPPAYVKPFVKRQKNDAADAEAICEAAQRPSMRFVAMVSGHSGFQLCHCHD